MCHHHLDSNVQMKPEGSNSGVVNRGESVDLSKPLEVNTEHTNQDGHSHSLIPLASSIPSLESCNGTDPICGEFLVDFNSGERNLDETGTGNGKTGPNGHLEKSGSFISVNLLDKAGLAINANQKEGSFEGTDDAVDATSEDAEAYPFDEFWVPPEAVNKDDEQENSVVAVDDDEDEFGDGLKWGRSLSGFEDGESSSYRSKEEKEKAMEEVKNGKFRSLVSQLLKTIGVVSDEGSNSWVDIVSSLAWEAASFVKPDATKGKAMDPAGYVKVKCVACGSNCESQLIKGLVFKKHAAHKRMPTKHKNPRLLLLKGMLGQSTGLSSFNSMIPQGGQGNTSTMTRIDMSNEDKTLIDNLEACHPDVVLVEKSVSRNMLEKLLDKGITLVIDMKHHRLERVSQCTGSPILSADAMLSQKLKHCDSLYFEKLVEEYSQSEGGKKSQKTLLFLEGSPTRLGCTILLRGSRSEELKKIKWVVQCAVVMAYHFTLETSFLLDQEAMFSTVGTSDLVSARSGECSQITSCNASASFNGGLSVDDASKEKIDAPLPNGIREVCFSDKTSSDSFGDISAGSKSVSVNEIDIHIAGPACEHIPEVGGPASLSLSSSGTVEIPISGGTAEWEDKSVVLDQPEMPANSSELSYISASMEAMVKKDLPTAYPAMRPYLYLGEVSVSEELSQHVTEAKGNANEHMLLHGSNDYQILSSSIETARDMEKPVGQDLVVNRKKDEISTVLDSESILVLMSSRNAKRGTICEHRRFSHIKFYKNFDVPLGKFLQDNLLNQNLPCKTCNEQPDVHFYYYAHNNKQLTIRVKTIPDKNRLPGESEGKLWMWSRCGKCKPEKGDHKKCTRRVLISSVARGLSFGKFLELTFSNHSTFNRLSSCGHSLHRDFLYFFGLGPMVAMFRYSPVITYAVSVPPQKLEFSDPIKGEWLHKEIQSVYTRAMLLFTEIANYLKSIEHQFSGLTLTINGSVKEFSDIEMMLTQETQRFQESIKSSCIKNSLCVRKLLCLNRLRWELLLEACIWNRRLQSLLSTESMVSNTSSCDKMSPEMGNVEADCTKKEIEAASPDIKDAQNLLGNWDNKALPESSTNTEVSVEYIPGPGRPLTADILCKAQQEPENLRTIDEKVDMLIADNLVSSLALQDGSDPRVVCECGEQSGTNDTAISNSLSKDRNIPIMEDRSANTSESLDKSSLSSANIGQWIWKSFSEIREECMKVLHFKDNLPSFLDSLRLDTVHSPDSLLNLSLIINEEGPRMHIPLCNGDYIVSDYEGEISSVLASALSLIIDLSAPQRNQCNSDNDQSETESSSSSEESVSLPRAVSEPSPLWSSSNSFQEPDGIQTTPSLSFKHSRLSSFDGLNLLDSLVSVGEPHREVSLGTERHSGKGKYSVVCIYADEFRSLRVRCCPSELDYIASLCRCKFWDAKGGKSKSFFAKTLDDRLIIKEIKRTELESFMKFAADYFRHMKQSVDSGNQTCLAKILGIYQVTIRQPKSGRETRHDLMVMENLSFGRSISRQYDLKGALHARFTAGSDGSGDVLLDQNFVMDMNNAPLYVGQKAKRLLQRAVWNDTTFLNNINVMDYSMLVGIDMRKKELVCGIIDYLRQYTWDKQLETWVKSSLVVPKNLLPTIISPKEYKRRFRKFMDTHFLTVPDRWCSQRSNPCKLCGTEGGGDRSSSLAKPEDPKVLKSSHAG